MLWIVALRHLILMVIDSFLFTGGYCFPVPGFVLLPACCVQFDGPEYARSRGLTIMHMPKRPLLEWRIVASLNV